MFIFAGQIFAGLEAHPENFATLRIFHRMLNFATCEFSQVAKIHSLHCSHFSFFCFVLFCFVLFCFLLLFLILSFMIYVYNFKKMVFKNYIKKNLFFLIIICFFIIIKKKKNFARLRIFATCYTLILFRS